MPFSFSEMIRVWPLLLNGAMITLYISILGILLGLVVGLGLFFLRRARQPILRTAADIYVSAIRGTPILVQILVIYYALPAVGIDISAPVAGVLALGLNSAGFVTEIFRGAYAAVRPSQREAAKSLGIGTTATWRRIIVPQMLIASLPALANEFTLVLKASALLSVITIVELTRTAQQIMSVTYRPLEALLAAASIYFVMCFALARLVRFLELSTRRYRF